MNMTNLLPPGPSMPIQRTDHTGRAVSYKQSQCTHLNIYIYFLILDPSAGEQRCNCTDLSCICSSGKSCFEPGINEATGGRHFIWDVVVIGMFCCLIIFLHPRLIKTLHPVRKWVLYFAPCLQSTYRYLQHVEPACQGITMAYCFDNSATIIRQKAMMYHAADPLC